MSKIRKFKVDEWVLYCPFPDSDFENLRNMQNRSLVLYIRPENDFYDYDIYIEKSEKIKKVREKNLSEIK